MERPGARSALAARGRSDRERKGPARAAPELGRTVRLRILLTGRNALADNLAWCDVVVYVSSTVALEALGRGRPVINLVISDPVDPDPAFLPA